MNVFSVSNRRKILIINLRMLFINMKPNLPISFLLLLSLCGFLLSCQSATSPEDVSKKFWQAVQQQDIEQIKKYSLEDSYSQMTDFGLLAGVEDFSLGKIIIDGDNADIETKVTINTDTKQNVLSISTHLLKQEDNWLVDYESTIAPIMTNKDMAELMGGIEELTDEFTKEVEGSVEEFKNKAVPEIKSKLEQAEQELKEQLPEIKKKIDEFLKDLEKSIQETMPQSQQEDSKTQET